MAGVITGRIAGAQTGAVLAFVSSGILGQYDPFGGGGPAGSDGGRLLLVYPNVIAVERQLRLDPRDFRMWVCLHEVTHRVQFTAVPWLSDYFTAETKTLVAAIDVPASELLGKSGQLLGAVMQVLRGKEGAQALLLSVLSPTQREVFDRISALMTLLEGHADVVMDEVGPEVVPTVASIRARFNERRKQPGTMDSVVRKVLGMDAKMRQYSDGAAFVRHVVDRVGMARFNVVWSGPESLPKPDEIENPQQWIDRVL